MTSKRHLRDFFVANLREITLARYRAANAVFGKIGKHASEKVSLQRVLSWPKCLSVLLCGLEACMDLINFVNNSLDFSTDHFFLKLF